MAYCTLDERNEIHATNVEINVLPRSGPYHACCRVATSYGNIIICISFLVPTCQNTYHYTSRSYPHANFPQPTKFEGIDLRISLSLRDGQVPVSRNFFAAQHQLLKFPSQINSHWDRSEYEVPITSSLENYIRPKGHSRSNLEDQSCHVTYGFWVHEVL